MGDLTKLYIDAFTDIKNIANKSMTNAMRKIKRIFT